MSIKLYEIEYTIKNSSFSDVAEGRTETEALDNFFGTKEYGFNPDITEVVCLGIKEEIYEGVNWNEKTNRKLTIRDIR